MHFQSCVPFLPTLTNPTCQLDTTTNYQENSKQTPLAPNITFLATKDFVKFIKLSGYVIFDSLRQENFNIIKKETLAFSEISKNTFSYRTPPVAASVEVTLYISDKPRLKEHYFPVYVISSASLLKSYQRNATPYFSDL